MIARAKIVQTNGMAKKKLAFLWAFLSAAYLGTIVQSSANERNGKKKLAFLWAFLSAAYLGTIVQSSANEGNAKEKARFSLGIPECRTLQWIFVDIHIYCLLSRPQQFAGCGPRGRPHPTGRQGILSCLRHSLLADGHKSLSHLRHSLLADGP